MVMAVVLVVLILSSCNSMAGKPEDITFHDISISIPAGYQIDESISNEDSVYYKTYDKDKNLQNMIYLFYQQGDKEENILEEENASAFCEGASSGEGMHDYSGYKIVDIDGKLSALRYTVQTDNDDKTYNTTALTFMDSEGGIYSIYTASLDDSDEIIDSIMESFSYKFEIWKESFDLKLEVTFEQNLFLDIYEVEIYIDKDKLGTVSQGNTFKKDIKLKEGKHSIIFYKSGNHDVSGKTEIDMTEGKWFTCSIKSHSEDIDINNQKEESLEEYNKRIEKEEEEAKKKAEEEKKRKEEEKKKAEEEKKRREAEEKEREAEEQAIEAEEEKLEVFCGMSPYDAISGIKALGYKPVFLAANTKDDMTSQIESEDASNPNGWIISGIGDINIKRKIAEFIVTSEWMRENLYS